MISTNLIPKIIFEDEDILVLDKPAGLTVDRASTNSSEFTLQDWLENYINRHAIASRLIYNSSDFENRSGIVHRLDKETSGLLVVAKNQNAFTNLQSQFKNREVVKKYLALAHGKVEPKEGTITVPVARNPFHKKKFGVFLGGREALTEYKTIGNYYIRHQNDVLTLLEVFPHTGRTHQIRVHLKYINHPVVGDILYGGRKNLTTDKLICPRMFLHASFLKFKHPKNGKEMEFKIVLPKELKDTLGKLI